MAATARPTRPKHIVLVLAVALLVIGVAAPAVAGGATTDRVDGPFETVVPVAFADNAIGVELMFAECDWVQRVQLPDESAKETQLCHLTEPFFVFGGSPPDQAFNIGGGPCLWVSDYWTQSTGADVVADSHQITVTPSGNVHITSTYPAEPIPISDC